MSSAAIMNGSPMSPKRVGNVKSQHHQRQQQQQQQLISNGGGSGGLIPPLAPDNRPPPWKIGLVNHQGKYLTAEAFGFKINAAGMSLRRKQMWTVEPDRTEDETVYIRSQLGRYLSGDRKGNVSCCSEERGEAEKFVIQYHRDGSGRWAICNRATGYYFGGTGDQLMCYEKQPGQSEWWIVHLAIHPQVNLRNVSRQKYARFDPQFDQLQVTELIPWGRAAVIELEFRDGRYCIRACDGRYLTRDGVLVNGPDADTMFTVEMRSVGGGQLTGMALRDSTGRYLTAVGRDAVIQSRNKTIGKDELFLIEDSLPQVFFTAHNGRVVSIRQGLNVTAIYADDELTDKETFQLEFDKKSDQLRIRTAEDTYWILAESGGGIQSAGNARSASGLFSIDWLSDGSVALRAANGRYVTARMNGSLNAIAETPTDRERFLMTIVNRPQLVFRCEYGYLGLRSAAHPRYECNRTTHDVVFLEHSDGTSGVYYLRGHNGKYLSVAVDGTLNADQQFAEHPFVFELRGHSRLALRASNGCYVRGEQNGLVSATAVELSKATFWDY